VALERGEGREREGGRGREIKVNNYSFLSPVSKS
jgi:hypothetical protein